MAALPRTDSGSAGTELADATAAFVRQAAEAWQGPSAPAVRLLPRKVPAGHLPKGSEHPDRGIPIGIGETSLEPVHVDFETDPFLLVFGESESGKTAALRHLAHKISERYTADEAKIVVGDYRRTLLGAVSPDHLLEYAATDTALTGHMEALAGLMERRRPGPDVTPQQLRDRSWWTGPRFFVVIDDYDLVTSSAGNPLAVLTDHLPFARDAGIHFLIARTTAGVSRALFEPFLQRIKELGAQGLILSGDPHEGDILGTTRPHPMPPGRAHFVSRKRGLPWCSSDGCLISSGIERACRTAIPLPRGRKPTGASRCHEDWCAQCRGNSVLRVAFGAMCRTSRISCSCQPSRCGE